MNDNVTRFETYRLRAGEAKRRLHGGPGGPYDGGMDQRLTRLEARFDAFGDRFDGVERRLDRIEDKMLTKWDIAQVVFVVATALMAAAYFAPRLMSLII